MPVAPTPTRRASPWPQELHGNAWRALYDATWQQAMAVNGKGKAAYTNSKGTLYPDTVYPKLTNGQAVTLIMSWMFAVGTKVDTKWALWYQLAAVAYGWTPDRDRLDTSTRQRDAWYPGVLTIELWMQLDALSSMLDGGKTSPAGVTLALDGDFSDPTFQGQVASALRGDGATVQWKIPLPACKDPKTGKPTGRPHKDKNGKWTCDPVVVDDPITRAKQSVNGFLVLMAVVAIVAWGSDSSRRKRQRN